MDRDEYSSQVNRIGFWTGMWVILLGLFYIILIILMMLSGSGFPPHEPYLTHFHLLILLTAVSLVFFWAGIHRSAPPDRQHFSLASLAMVIIFAALTGINRYVALTVVRQSLQAGRLEGLEWFMPYGWPSVMLAIEYLAWGFFFGLACLFLAPVFRRGKYGRLIMGSLVVTGCLCLLAPIGQALGPGSSLFDLFGSMGAFGWGPMLTISCAFIAVKFRTAATTAVTTVVTTV